MKKLALILAIAMIAAFASPAMASDFTAAGQARYEAINVDYDSGEDGEYFDQRFRVAFTWKVNDNVTTQLRADFAESRWGSSDYYDKNSGAGGYRYEPGDATIMVDRAWVKINQGPLTLTVGQQAGSWGMIWSDQFQGIQAGLDFAPIYVNLLYVKESEGEARVDDDIDIYGGQVGFATDAFDVSFIYAYLDNEEIDPEEDISGYGINLSIPLDMLTLQAGLAIFDGEDNPSTDYAGTQAFVDAGFAISDAFKMGVTFVWADDVDDDEDQVTALQDDLGWNYTDFGGVLGYNNGLVVGTEVFEVDTDQGSIGGVVRAQFAAMDNLTFYGKLGYFEPNGNEEDIDSLIIANASVDWVWVPAVTVSAGAFYKDVDSEDDSEDGDTLLTTLQLTVAF